jgi:putative glutamine amidotransferase
MKNNNQKKAPVIGISATLLTIESGSFMGRERTAVVHDYIEAIRLAGGIPLCFLW